MPQHQCPMTKSEAFGTICTISAQTNVSMALAMPAQSAGGRNTLAVGRRDRHPDALQCADHVAVALVFAASLTARFSALPVLCTFCWRLSNIAI